jgi:N-acetylmuramic acid 6-phosphate etherase
MNAAEEFLKVATDYQLGALDTESQHPFTTSLSQMAHEDVGEAVKLMHQVDVLALRQFAAKSAPLADLARAVGATFNAGKRVFLCGCGATGRLSLSIEIFCRMGVLPAPDPERVVAFMAGGDLALIKAIETFEDHPEYGARQLEELGFAQGDLLIATTEGGETPFVIGAVERAAELSSNHPWFLYCNPDEQLIHVAVRSKRVIENPAIRKMNLAVGAMAISGSTRLQASTVLMAAVGFAFLHQHDPENAPAEVLQLLRHVAHCDGQFLVAVHRTRGLRV